MRGASRLAACIGLVALVGCIDITVDSAAIGSLEFQPFPYPSIDAGDTLRDSLGVAAPLKANVYLANGALDTKAAVSFVALDAGLTTPTATGYVLGAAMPDSVSSRLVRIIASTGNLQSPPRSLLVVPRPDTIFRDPDVVRDTIEYSLPAEPSDTSMSLGVRLMHRTAAGLVGVGAYLVRYRVFNFATPPQPLAANDTTLAFFLIGDGGRVSTIDTTAQGTASRKLRFRIRSGQNAIDSVRVLAQVRRGSRIVPGDSINWVVVVKPK